MIENCWDRRIHDFLSFLSRTELRGGELGEPDAVDGVAPQVVGPLAERRRARERRLELPARRGRRLPVWAAGRRAGGPDGGGRRRPS